MAKLPLVECRLCKAKIDRNLEQEGVDWIMPSRGWYYHKKCYTDWKNSIPATDEEYVRFIYDFLSHDLKVKYDFHMIEAQRKGYIKDKKMTNKGIFFSLKYFYEIKNGDWSKSHGGIGIIPYIYNEACGYWVAKNRESENICSKIERQYRQMAEREQVVVHRKKKKKKVEVNLEMVAEMSDE